MKSTYGMLIVGSIALAGAGCGNSGQTEESPSQTVTGGVAVIDLDQLAEKLGRDVAMTNSIRDQSASLNQQLSNLQNSLLSQVEEKEQKLGDIPTEEQSKELQGIKRQAGINLNQARQKAQAVLNQHSQQLVSRFREEVRPLAREVADEKGLSVVVTKNDSVVFTFQDAIDITGEVALRMRSVRQSTSTDTDAAAPQSARKVDHETRTR